MTNSNTNLSAASVRFAVDFINKKIIGTKASFDKASKGSGSIYEELASKVAAHPDYELVVKKQKSRSNKKKEVYSGLNFPFMEAYISIQSNSLVLMREYESVKKFAKKQKISIYPITKKWFLGNFDPNGTGFDMVAAKQEIIAAGLSIAVMEAYEEEAENNGTELGATA